MLTEESVNESVVKDEVVEEVEALQEVSQEGVLDEEQSGEENASDDDQVPNLDKNRSSFDRRPIIIGGSAVLLLLLVLTLFWPKASNDNTSKTEEDLVEQEEEYNYNQVVYNISQNFDEIYNRYKTIYVEERPTGHGQVIRAVDEVRQKLEEIDDAKLREEYVFFKYNILVVTYKILALLNREDPEKQRENSRLMLENVNHAKTAIDAIYEIEDPTEREQMVTWFESPENKFRIRLMMNQLIGAAVNYKTGGYTSKNKVLDLLEEVESREIIKDELYDNYPIVIWVRELYKSSKNEKN